MTALDRRAFMATTAVCVVTPTALGAKECPTMDWITMSLEARNLAYNNVEHVGPDNARKKTEGWAAASKTLREQRSQHLDLAYGTGERNKWDLYPANDPKAPCFVHIHGGSLRLHAGPGGELNADHQRAKKRVRLAQRQCRRARDSRTDYRHRLVRR